MSKAGSVGGAVLAAGVLGLFIGLGKLLAGRVHQWRVNVYFPDGKAATRVFGFNNRLGGEQWGEELATAAGGGRVTVVETSDPASDD